MNEHGDAEISRQFIDAAHLGTIEGDRILEFPEADGAFGDGFGEAGNGIGLSHVGIGEAEEALGMGGLSVLGFLLPTGSGKDDGLVDAGAIDVMDLLVVVATRVEVDVEDRAAPAGLLLLGGRHVSGERGARLHPLASGDHAPYLNTGWGDCVQPEGIWTSSMSG